MERIIKVTGKGKISIKPDLIRLLINLEDKREKISDIATRVGFSSVRTFNRAFLDIMGMTPGEYRAKKQPQVAKGEPKA